MYTTKFHIDSVYITGMLVGHRKNPCILSLNDHITLYTIGPGTSCYCIIVDKPLEKAALSTILQEYLDGSYLLTDIQTDVIPHFCLLLSRVWLQEQLADQKTKIDALLQKTINAWLETGNTTTYWKHMVFQQRYQREKYKALLVQTYSLEILYRLLTECQLEPYGVHTPAYKDAELKKVLDIGESIAIDLHKPVLTIKAMSLLAGISESKFKKVFNEVFGQSPHQYILGKKMEHAKELLKSGQYTLTQIAYKLGYNHTSGFTRLYKKKYGN